MRFWLKFRSLIFGWPFWLSVLFFWYFSSLIPSDVVSYGWSTDLARIGYLGGNYSSIQFGFLLRIVNFFTNLLPFSVIVNSYVLASFLGSIVLGIFYKLLSTLESVIAIGDKKIGFLLKNLIVVLLGTSQSFLLQSLFIERYMLVVLGLEFIALLIIRLQKNRKRLSNDHVFLVIAFVLGISYHWIFLWTLILLTVGLMNKREISKNYLMSLVSGFLLISLSGIIVGHLLITNKLAPHTFVGGKDIYDSIDNYLKTYFTDGFSQSLSINLKQMIPTLSGLTKKFNTFYGALVGLFGLIGIRVLMNKFGKRSAIGLIFLTGVFLWPSLWFSDAGNILEISELYELIIITSLSIYSWVGVMFVSDRLFRGFSVIHGKPTIRTFFSLVVGGMIIMSLSNNLSDSRNSSFEADEMRGMLNQLPKESLLLCFDDLVCADLIYLSQVEKAGDEIMVVPYYFHPKKYELNLSEYQLFKYEEHPYIIHEIISLALTNDVRVFSVGIANDYYKFLGFNLGFVHYLPIGNYGEVLLTTPNDWPIVKPLKYADGELKENTLLENKFINLMIENRVLNSYTYFLSGKYAAGYSEMTTTSRVASQLSSNDFSMFLVLRSNAENQVKNNLFIESNKQDSIDRIFDEIPLYIEGGYHGRSADLTRGAIMLNPLDADIRKKSADVYEKINLHERAEFEMNAYQKLLEHIPI